jgi:hypothetical protein
VGQAPAPHASRVAIPNGQARRELGFRSRARAQTASTSSWPVERSGILSILPFGFHLRRLRVPNSFQYPVERHRDVERRWKRWLQPTVLVKKPESRREIFSGSSSPEAPRLRALPHTNVQQPDH